MYISYIYIFIDDILNLMLRTL